MSRGAGGPTVERIVLATFGSYGDLFPYLSIGQRLNERGHTAVIAAPETYRVAVKGAGIEFAPIRPDVAYDDPETIRRAMDPKRGIEVVIREILLPHLRDSYRDLEAACENADLLASHMLTYAAPILGEKKDIPWVSTVLMPMVFCSAYDPPALAPIPWFARLRPLGPGVVRVLWRLLRRLSWSWSEPIRGFREELGLGADADPLWEGQFSPHGTLALFSSVLAKAQPDWPRKTTVCGFPFHDDDFGGNADSSELKRFLAAGAAPLVFSLGSSAVFAAGDFYKVAGEAATRLKQRAVMIVGDTPMPENLPDEVLAIRSAEVSSLFTAASIVVHAGGVGTTGQAMRAGRPQLVIPVAHDQFDNALRVERLGIGRSLRRKQLEPRQVSRVLEQLLEEGEPRAKAAATGEAIRSEDGAGATCDALERVLESARR